MNASFKSAVVGSFAALAVAAPASAAPVSWSFFETSISCAIGTCHLVNGPVAALILESETSAGTAEWPTGQPIFPGDPPPTHTGDNFDLQFGPNNNLFSSADLTGRFTFGPDAIHSYTVLWTEVARSLNNILVDVITFSESAHLTASGGFLSSDRTLGGCVETTCRVTGEWRPDAIPAPAGFVALLLVGVAIGYRALPSKRHHAG